MSPQRLSLYLVIYAVFLLSMGIAGWLLQPSTAITSLLGGVAGGIWIFTMSRLVRRNVQWAHTSVLTAIGIFTLTFAWRGMNTVIEVTKGNDSKLSVAIVLVLLFIVSLIMSLVLFNYHKQ
jgi:uncharacterized membrane protein (UPF0136 family)